MPGGRASGSASTPTRLPLSVRPSSRSTIAEMKGTCHAGEGPADDGIGVQPAGLGGAEGVEAFARGAGGAGQPRLDHHRLAGAAAQALHVGAVRVLS